MKRAQMRWALIIILIIIIAGLLYYPYLTKGALTSGATVVKTIADKIHGFIR
jgi:cytochrome c oxidase subunit IV